MAELKKARDILLAVWHPDKFPAEDADLYARAERRTQDLHDAYVRLSDSNRRVQYDAELAPASDYSDVFADPLQNQPAVWKRMAAYMKDENVGTGFHRKMAFTAGNLLERRLQPTERQRPHMLEAWKLAINEGFDLRRHRRGFQMNEVVLLDCT